MKFSKIKACLVFVLSALFFVSGASAYEEHYVIPREISVSYNGERIDFEDVQPTIVEGRTMVPLRGIFEKAGSKVEFDGEGQRVIVSKESEEMVFRLGEQKVFLNQNGEIRYAPIDVAPFISEGRTLVPVRFIAENLGMIVNWNEYYKEVVLIDFNQWKTSIAANAKFADLMFNQKIWHYEGPANTSTDGKLKISFKSPKIEEPYFSLPESDITLEMITKDAAVYDGKNYKVNTNIVTDLTPLQIFAQANGAEYAIKFLKEYDINIETYLDQEYNLYIKSDEILDILKEAEIEQANVIGDNFVKIPLQDLYFYQTEDGQDIDFYEMTYWDVIKMQVSNDSYLYTGSVKQIDGMFRVLEGLFHNDKVKTAAQDSGAIVYSVELDKTQILTILNRVFGFDESADEDTVKMLESLIAQIRLQTTIQDGMFTDTELQFQFGFEELDLDGHEITFVEELEQKSTSTIGDNPAKPIELPEKVIHIYDIE